VNQKFAREYASPGVNRKYSLARTEYVEIDGTKLHFMIRGNGRPVVLIHGNPGSCEDWSRLYGPLAERFCAFAFDRPGHGHSERPDHLGDVTVEVQARLLSGALSDLRVKQPILVGHSWGAALALIYAQLYPQDVSGLVLLAPAVYESKDGVSFLSKLPAWPVIGDVVNFLFTPFLAAWLVRTDLAKSFAPDKVPPKYLRHTLSEWTRPRKVKAYSVDDALLNASLAKFSPTYSQVTVPTVIVTGDSDLIVPADENAFRLSHNLPNSTLTVLPQTGHQIPFTQPEAIVSAIEQVAST
jgi:pimeloyl-ACP methyl ester carboxylesterase